MFTNQLNQSLNQGLYLQKVGTQSVHCQCIVSGILGKPENKKSPNTFCIKAFKAGPTRLELATSCVTGRN